MLYMVTYISLLYTFSVMIVRGEALPNAYRSSAETGTLHDECSLMCSYYDKSSKIGSVKVCSSETKWSMWSWTRCDTKGVWNRHREKHCHNSTGFSFDLSGSHYLICDNGYTIESNGETLECNWSPWEGCTASCGTGLQNRTRITRTVSVRNISRCNQSVIKMASDITKVLYDKTNCTENNGTKIIKECLNVTNCSNEKMHCEQKEYVQYRQCNRSNCPACDWKEEQSTCFKGTAVKKRLINIDPTAVKCEDIRRMNYSCDIKLNCGNAVDKYGCDDCKDCHGACSTSISYCNITVTKITTTDKVTNTIYRTDNALQISQKRKEDIICREWSTWSWTLCQNNIWNQHRYRPCRYPSFFSNTKNCHLSESNYVYCSNDYTSEHSNTPMACKWSPWTNCTISCGTEMQNRTKAVCLLSFGNVSQCDVKAIRMASSCQEIEVTSTASWTSWYLKNGENIGQRNRSNSCSNQMIECKRIEYEYIENKSCGGNLCAPEAQSGTSNTSVGPVIGSVAAGVVVVVVFGAVVVTFFVLRRQKTKKDRIDKEKDAVTNATYDMKMEADNNAYDDLTNRISQHVYGTIDTIDGTGGDYSLAEHSNIPKHHNNDNKGNSFVFGKHKTSEAAKLQESDVGDNYFILEKTKTMKTSKSQPLNGDNNITAAKASISKDSDEGGNYFILEKEGTTEMTIPQQLDDDENYFILEKEGTTEITIPQQLDDEGNYFILDKTETD